MSVVTWTSEKTTANKQRALVRRLVRGPVLILAICACSSGILAAALLVSSIFEY